MRFRVVGPLVAAIGLVSGCGAGDTATSSTAAGVSNAEVATVSTEPATPTVLAPSGTNTSVTTDGWEQTAAVLATTGIAIESDVPGAVPWIHAIGSTSAGFLVAGSVEGRFTVWRSEDLESFEAVYAETCCERYLIASSIAEFQGTVLIGASGEFAADRTRRSFLLRSDDGGASWTSIEDPLFTSTANRVDRILVTDEVVLVDTVDDRETGAQPWSVAAWTDDLTTWQPVELPGRQAEDWPSFVQTPQAVFAVAQRSDGPQGSLDSWVIWRSDDGGRHFVPASGLAGVASGTFLGVGGTLVAVPSNDQGEYRHVDARGLLVLEGSEWRGLEPDTGTWGDGSIVASPTVTSGSSGQTYVLVSRVIRASPHYCYADVDTCQQPETALLATEDGYTWYDVAGFPAAPHVGHPTLLTTDQDGHIVVLAGSYEPQGIQVRRWTDGAPPPVVDNPDYAAPDIPRPLYDYEKPFDIGDERRYVLPIGGCGSMYVGQNWEPAFPLPDPLPLDWPYRPVQSADGPQGFVYGQIHRLASDTIEFSIEGLGPVATFHPARARGFPCP